MNYTWKRVRKWLKPKQDAIYYEERKKALDSIKYLGKTGYLKLFYGDATHFSLDPSISSAWQPNEYLKIVPQKTKVTTVFGLISTDLTSKFATFSGNLTTDDLLPFLENFAKQQQQPTVIVLDNAPIHRSKKMKKAITEWKELYDVFVFFLPPYSPHLNLIEIVWRKMKYDWLPPSVYQNSDTLFTAIQAILSAFGTQFIVHFST